jgi:hypothetical protein
MSDSDTPLPPSDEAISQALRHVVVSLHKAGNTNELTVKRVRTRAEDSLGLPAGYFKGDQRWKQKSHQVILDAVVSTIRRRTRFCRADPLSQEKYCGDEPAPEPSAPISPEKPVKKKPALKGEKRAVDVPRGQKRKAATPPKKPQKRAKAVISSGEDSDETPDSPARKRSDAPKRPAGRARKAVIEEDSDEEDRAGTPEVQSPKAGTAGETNQHDSESELSSLIDESPVKKKRQKKTATEKRTSASKSKAPHKVKSRSITRDADPDEAEIKRLQGWLLKCGIRKVWSKELARYDTSKEKIKHLKEMLKDVGMEGKYSVEKAATIKEERELAKDLEAIQEGERSWGKVENSGGGGRPKRRAAMATPKAVIPELDDDEENDSDEPDAVDESDGVEESSAQDSGHTSDDDEEDSE